MRVRGCSAQTRGVHLPKSTKEWTGCSGFQLSPFLDYIQPQQVKTYHTIRILIIIKDKQHKDKKSPRTRASPGT